MLLPHRCNGRNLSYWQLSHTSEPLLRIGQTGSGSSESKSSSIDGAGFDVGVWVEVVEVTMAVWIEGVFSVAWVMVVGSVMEGLLWA